MALCLAAANGCLSGEEGAQGLADGGSTSPELNPELGLNTGTTPQAPREQNGPTVAPGTAPTATNPNLPAPAAPSATVPDKAPAKAYVASLFDGSCLDVHRIGAVYDVNLYDCSNNNGGQQWNVLANGQLQWSDDANLCLGLSTSATAKTIPLTLARCGGDAAQV